jgi:RHS repeat-associated protein
VLSDGTNSYLYGVSRLGEEQPGGWLYHLGDALGSVRQLTDESGGVVLAKSYEPYGENLSSVGEASSVYQFTGEMRDPTGLMYLRARYLDSYLNQFLQRDPIVPNPYNPWEWNRYTYSRNNPVNYTDPTGKNSTTTLARFTKHDETDENIPEWTQFDKQQVQEALWDIAGKYSITYNQELWFRAREGCGWYQGYTFLSPSSAFIYLHGGPITFEKESNDPGYWGKAQSKNHIYIYSAAKFGNKRFVVHEMGHAFENALDDIPGWGKLGREGIHKNLWFRNYEGERFGGFAGGQGDWQWSREEGGLRKVCDEDGKCRWIDGRGEIFADMFIGWVYNQWEKNQNGPGWSAKGQERADYMSNNMPNWIFNAINAVRGW